MHAQEVGLGPIMWLSLPRRVSSFEQQNFKVCKVEYLDFTPWSHDGLEVAVELLYTKYDNDKYFSSSGFKN